MRRWLAFVAVVALVVIGFEAGVNASAPQRPAAASPGSTKTIDMGQKIKDRLARIEALAPNSVKLCGLLKPSDVTLTKIADCFNKLQGFAKDTQQQLTALNKFVNKFFSCTNYKQLTQYGDPTATDGTPDGYVYDPDGTGANDFLTFAIQDTIDLQNDPFNNYYVVKPTAACIAFESQ